MLNAYGIKEDSIFEKDLKNALEICEDLVKDGFINAIKKHITQPEYDEFMRSVLKAPFSEQYNPFEHNYIKTIGSIIFKIKYSSEAQARIISVASDINYSDDDYNASLSFIVDGVVPNNLNKDFEPTVFSNTITLKGKSYFDIILSEQRLGYEEDIFTKADQHIKSEYDCLVGYSLSITSDSIYGGNDFI